MFRLLLLCLLSACTLTSKPLEKAKLGQLVSEKELVDSLQSPGTIRFQKIVAADWSTELAGMIDLKDPKAEKAGLKPGHQDIQIYFYVIDHPSQGRFIVDTAVSQQMKDDLENSPLGGITGKFLNTKAFKPRVALKEFLTENPAELKGAFFTHLHPEHVLGLVDLPHQIPLYVGPGEASSKTMRNAFTRILIDQLFEGERRISELEFSLEKHSILDVFGDKTFFAIWVPGHTPGSLAFIVNSSDGPQFLLGDSSHTRWGWENEVPPGLFTAHNANNKESLAYLRSLAPKIPGVHVHPGHQP